MWVKNCIIAPPFMDGWIKNTAWNTDIRLNCKLQRAFRCCSSRRMEQYPHFIYHFFKILIDE